MTELKESLGIRIDPVKQAAYWFVSVLQASGVETYSRYRGQFTHLEDAVTRFRELLIEKEGVDITTKVADSALIDFRRDFPHFGKLETDITGQTLIAVEKERGSHIGREDKDKFTKVKELVGQMGY
ncbi:MAG TPA: hypothetical protein VJ227_00310 [Patescibacteria group bacterium]|nr:hypothetical protein [Patescibacteria group bacterium]